MRQLKKVLLCTIAALAALPASAALASSVSVSGTAPNKTLKVTAADAEGANSFLVKRIAVPSDNYVISDSNPITFSAPCVDGATLGQPAGTRACPVTDITLIEVSAKDGNDTVTIDATVIGPVKGDLSGSTGDDTLQGGPIDEVMTGGSGADVFKGGGGADRVDYAGHGTPTTVTIGAGTNNDGSTSDVSATDPNKRDDVQADVEDVLGGKVDDRITGSAGANVLDGATGDDTLIGAGGADTLTGGLGRDDADYSDHAGGVSADLDGAADDGNAAEDGPGMDRVGADVEDLTGSRGDDTLTGNGVANRLSGGSGADRLLGLGGGDTLNGQAGNDTMLGGSGRDLLSGRAGDDQLFGEGSGDVLFGGAGVDRFSGSRGNDVILARDGVRDRRIRCGRGRRDRAKVDRRRPRDPKAKGCERRI